MSSKILLTIVDKTSYINKKYWSCFKDLKLDFTYAPYIRKKQTNLYALVFEKFAENQLLIG